MRNGFIGVIAFFLGAYYLGEFVIHRHPAVSTNIIESTGMKEPLSYYN